MISAKRVVYKGEKFWEILSFSCYDYDELPFKYFETLPICAKDKDKFVVIYSDEQCLEFKVGDLISDESFRRLIRTIKFVGHKLHLIMLEIAKLKQQWIGEETFDISAESWEPKPRMKKKEKKTDAKSEAK